MSTTDNSGRLEFKKPVEETKVSHTPGPWRVSNNGCDIEQNYGDNSGICTLYAISEKQDEANARLIASAPDLLKENQELKAKIDALDEELWIDIKKLQALNKELVSALKAAKEYMDTPAAQSKGWPEGQIEAVLKKVKDAN